MYSLYISASHHWQSVNKTNNISFHDYMNYHFQNSLLLHHLLFESDSKELGMIVGGSSKTGLEIYKWFIRYGCENLMLIMYAQNVVMRHVKIV